MALSRQAAREIYRPLHAKIISLGTATPNLLTGGSIAYNQQVDLSLPIRGFQLQFRGRHVIGGAGMATTTPEGYLNFLNSITIQGVNSRQQGNLTLWNVSLADFWSIANIHTLNGNGTYIIDSGTGETVQPRPTMPFPVSYNPTGTLGTYDFKITVQIPTHPLGFNAFGNAPFSVPLFGLRNEEWKDSIQLILGFQGQPNGAVAGALGTGAASTTHTFSAYGSSSGTPVIDLYSLPFMSGLTHKDTYLPGILSRVTYPVTSTLQQSGMNVSIANLQKQPTPRIYIKQGTSTVPGVFTTLTDKNITTLGIQLGGNRAIRNTIDIQSHKAVTTEEYGTPPITGYNLMDFVQNGNYDSHFPGQDIGDGATFTLQANVAGVASAAANVIQEQMLHAPSGAIVQG